MAFLATDRVEVVPATSLLGMASPRASDVLYLGFVGMDGSCTWPCNAPPRASDVLYLGFVGMDGSCTWPCNAPPRASDVLYLGFVGMDGSCTWPCNAPPRASDVLYLGFPQRVRVKACFTELRLRAVVFTSGMGYVKRLIFQYTSFNNSRSQPFFLYLWPRLGHLVHCVGGYRYHDLPGHGCNLNQPVVTSNGRGVNTWADVLNRAKLPPTSMARTPATTSL
jgi:hypothetical protein